MILVLRLSKTDANLATQMFDIVLSITVVSVNSLASLMCCSPRILLFFQLHDGLRGAITSLSISSCSRPESCPIYLHDETTPPTTKKVAKKGVDELKTQLYKWRFMITIISSLEIA